MTGFPPVHLAALTSEAALRVCLEVFTGVVQDLRSAPAGTPPEEAAAT